MKKQKLPKWFTGELYTHGAEVTNPFSGESYSLTTHYKIINDFDKALSWFRTNNAKAYMVLLD